MKNRDDLMDRRGLSPHLAACMPLGFARHGPVHWDRSMSRLIRAAQSTMQETGRFRLTSDHYV